MAIAWKHAGSPLRLLFDPSTHAYRAIQILDPGQTVTAMKDCVVRYEIVDSLSATR